MAHRFLHRCGRVIFLLLVFFILYKSIWVAVSSSNSNISFLWSFAAITGAQDQRKIVSMTSNNVLLSGDKIKLMFEARGKGSVYIIFKGSGGEIVLLHPKKLGAANRPPNAYNRVFIPNEKEWLILDQQVGTETIYLVVSSNPLVDLEQLFKRYDSASKKRKIEVAQSIVTLLGEKEKSNQSLTAAVEKPIQIGGTIRSITDHSLAKEDISKFAQEVAVEDLFIRIYSIDHR